MIQISREHPFQGQEPHAAGRQLAEDAETPDRAGGTEDDRLSARAIPEAPRGTGSSRPPLHAASPSHRLQQSRTDLSSWLRRGRRPVLAIVTKRPPTRTLTTSAV